MTSKVTERARPQVFVYAALELSTDFIGDLCPSLSSEIHAPDVLLPSPPRTSQGWVDNKSASMTCLVAYTSASRLGHLWEGSHAQVN